MPTYDYRCDNCQYIFEEFQSITAKPLRKCPQCGKLKLKRLLGTGAGIIFKGDGFYQTDYRSESYKQGANAEKPKKESTDKKGTSSKSDSTSSGSGAKKEKAAGNQSKSK